MTIKKNANTGRSVEVKAGRFLHRGIYLGEDSLLEDTHRIGIKSSTCRPGAALLPNGFISNIPFYAKFSKIKFVDVKLDGGAL